MDKTIGQRGLAVIDMRNNREIADVLAVCHENKRDAPERDARGCGLQLGYKRLDYTAKVISKALIIQYACGKSLLG
jgi:hypothetical protein